MKKKYIQPLLSISSLSASIILAASGGNSSPARSAGSPSISSSTLNESQMKDLGFNNLAKSINNFIFDEDE